MILTALDTTTTTATAPAATPAATQAASAPWFAAWFDSPHYHTLYAHRSDTEAAAFIDALIARLQPGDDASILDLGCGAGRHAHYLASKGFCVTGLDLSGASIARAERFERPGLRFRRHDMRVPFGAQAFDYVFNMFTSFGYFADAAEHQLVIRNIANALQPGGRLVLDYLNVRHAEARLTPSEIKQIDGVTYRVTRWTDRTHFHKRIQIDEAVDHRRGGEHVERVAKFTLADFDDMFARCGLSIETVYGDYALQPYDVQTSPRLILVARQIDGGLAAREILANAAQGLR